MKSTANPANFTMRLPTARSGFWCIIACNGLWVLNQCSYNNNKEYDLDKMSYLQKKGISNEL